MLIQVSYENAISGWNVGNASNGLTIADMLDDAGGSSGIALRTNGSYSYSGSDRTTADAHGIPEAAWDGVMFASGADMQIQFEGLSAYSGQNYTLRTAHFSNSARDNDVTFNGQTLQYNSIASATPPVPLEFTGTLDGTDILALDIAQASGTTTTYLNFFTLEIVAAVANPGIRELCYDKDDALMLNETGMTLVFYDVLGGTEVLQTTASTDGTGLLTVDDDALVVGTSYVVIGTRSNGETLPPTTVTGIDLNA